LTLAAEGLWSWIALRTIASSFVTLMSPDDTDYKNLFIPFGNKRQALDEVAKSNLKCTHEGGKARVLCLLGCLKDQSISEREKSDTLLYTSSLNMFTDIVVGR